MQRPLEVMPDSFRTFVDGSVLDFLPKPIFSLATLMIFSTSFGIVVLLLITPVTGKIGLARTFSRAVLLIAPARPANAHDF